MSAIRTRLQGKHALLSVIAFSAALLAGCNPKAVKAVPVMVDGEKAEPSQWPNAAELRAITAPGYNQPPNVKSECFGRLVLDVATSVAWPTFYRWQVPEAVFNRSFSDNVADPGDEMRFGNTTVAVLALTDGIDRDSVLQSTPAAEAMHFKTRIKETQAYIERLKAKRKVERSDLADIKEAEGDVRRWEGLIKKYQEEYETFTPGLSNSEGYWTSTYEGNDVNDRYSVLRAYLERGEFIYIFESSVKMENAADKEAHKKDFTAMLAKFRTRAPNEIPKELGVCVPFGFIPDDGKTVVEFKQTLRFADAPGVLYTIETGNVHPRRLKSPLITALAHASISTQGYSDDASKPVVTQRIGPRSFKMGGLTGQQGGVVISATEPTGEKYEMYSIFTGYSGWLGIAALPYILVEMHTVTKAQAAELKKNPPPFKQSMDRLELLLKSMRLRPTNPPMPELAEIK